jgi:hypothetical protein
MKLLQDHSPQDIKVAVANRYAEVVLQGELPSAARREINDWFRCIGGALVKEDFLERLSSVRL